MRTHGAYQQALVNEKYVSEREGYGIAIIPSRSSGTFDLISHPVAIITAKIFCRCDQNVQG